MTEDAQNLDDWTVDAEIEDNILKISINLQREDVEGYSFHYFILCDALVIDRIHTDTPHYEYKLQHDGAYVAQCYIKKDGQRSLIARSMPRHYFLASTKKEYNKFLNSRKRGPNAIGASNLLQFCSQLPPFQDILVVSHRKTPGSSLPRRNGLPQIDAGSKEGLSCLEINDRQGWNTQIYGKRTCEVDGSSPQSDRRLIFSGMMVHEGVLITGESDSISSAAAAAMQGGTGIFSCVDVSTNSVRLHTDFFAFNRFFYYKEDDILFASNRYHLLLLSLTEAGIKLSLDRAKIISHFWSVSHQISLQNFTRKMDVSGVYQLPNEFDLSLEGGEWKFSQNEFGSILQSKKDLSEEDVSTSLDRIAKEMTARLEQVLHLKNFDNVVMDLSGGLDSRLVFAVATNIPDAARKVMIRTEEVPGEDLRIPIGINNIYKFGYDTVKTKVEYLDPVKMDQLRRSFYLGTYFSHGLQLTSNIPESSIQLNGACGEILARPYTVRNFLFGTRCELGRNSRDVVEEMVRLFSPHSLGGEASFLALRDLFLEEVEQFKSCSDFEAIDRIYLTYRHGFHFDGGITYGLQGLQWMPMQNKQLFKLHHYCFDRLRGLELQLALLYRLNPLLATLPYEREADNKELDRLRSVLARHDCRFSRISVLTSDDRSSFDRAVQNKARGREVLNSPYASAGDIHKTQYAAAFDFLRELMNAEHLNLPEEMGISIWHFLRKNESETRRVTTLYNKLASAVDQYRLVTDSHVASAVVQSSEVC